MLHVPVTSTRPTSIHDDDLSANETETEQEKMETLGREIARRAQKVGGVEEVLKILQSSQEKDAGAADRQPIKRNLPVSLSCIRFGWSFSPCTECTRSLSATQKPQAGSCRCPCQSKAPI